MRLPNFSYLLLTSIIAVYISLLIQQSLLEKHKDLIIF